MAKTYPIIKAVSDQIKNATTAASNTAAIVGGNLGDILDKVEEVDLAKVPTTRKVNSKALSADIALDKTDVGLGNVDNTSDANKPVSDATNTLVTNHTNRTDNPHTVTKSQVGLGNVDNTSDADKPISTAVDSALDLKADLIDGKVPIGQLPSYVDDVLECTNFAAFPITGESGKIYVALDTNLTYRWGGSAYTEISKSLALGETSTTAYRGDRGKTAYDHSQLTGNAHGTTASQIPNIPAGTIAATTVQAAINELDADRVQLETNLNELNIDLHGVDNSIYAQIIPAYPSMGYMVDISSYYNQTITLKFKNLISTSITAKYRTSNFTNIGVNVPITISSDGFATLLVEQKTLGEAYNIYLNCDNNDFCIYSVIHGVIENHENRIIGLESGVDTSYNNVNKNKSYLSVPIAQIKNKIANYDNRVIVSFNGDSIFGAQLSWMSQASDYMQGTFPPNLSRNIVARLFWERYRFADEDVQFRNIKHSDWVKTNFNKPYDNNTNNAYFNNLEVYSPESGAGSAQITVTGYKFFKLVWSGTMPAYAFSNMTVKVSVDGGEFVSPSAVTVSYTVPEDNNRVVNEILKIPDVLNPKPTGNYTELENIKYSVARLDPTKTYIFKIEGNVNARLWGCEMWNNKRLDVVVEAYSGSSAYQQNTTMRNGWYSSYHKPALVISDYLYLNDTDRINKRLDTIEQWKEGNTELGLIVKDKGIPHLVFITHHLSSRSVSYITTYINKLAVQNSCNIIDISKKAISDPPTQSITGSDGLHLSDYGNQYYFEELKKIFD